MAAGGELGELGAREGEREGEAALTGSGSMPEEAAASASACWSKTFGLDAARGRVLGRLPARRRRAPAEAGRTFVRLLVDRLRG